MASNFALTTVILEMNESGNSSFGDEVNAIVSSPLFLVITGIFLLGAVVSTFRRFLSNP